MKLYFVARHVIFACNFKYFDYIRYFIFQSIVKFPIVKIVFLQVDCGNVFISQNLKSFIEKICLNFRQQFIIKMHNNETFKQLKSNNFVLNISGLTKLINNLLILESITLKSYYPNWQKNYSFTRKRFPIMKFITLAIYLIIK